MQNQLTLKPPQLTKPDQGSSITGDWYDLDENIEINDDLYYDKDEPVRLWKAKKIARLIIYPKDIEMIYGKSPRFARRMLQTIRDALGKKKNQPVTIKEFCAYTGMDYWDVNTFIMES